MQHLLPETPPRAWGRQYGNHEKHMTMRNTPTCVGKTVATPIKRHITQKHPHVRGEDGGVGK